LSRFESGPLPGVLADPRVLKASEPYVRIIVRFPQTARFADRYGVAAMPGFAVLGPSGSVERRFQIDLPPDERCASRLAEFLDPK
jgi:hypothetical protein